MDRRQLLKTSGGFAVASATTAVALDLIETRSANKFDGRRQIALDTETTGLSPRYGHRLVEIGAVELVSGRMTGQRFHSYIDPERDIDSGAQSVHGLSREFLADKPIFRDVADALLAFVADSEVLIHNTRFDVSFLDAELALIGVSPFRHHCAAVTDTLTMARALHPGQSNSLDALCVRYGIDASMRTLHGALLDAELLGRVYLSMVSA